MAASNSTPPVLTAKQIARFWSKVTKGKPDECWPWTGYILHRDGQPQHGYAWFSPAKGVMSKGYGAHVIARWLATGEWPAGLVTRHECDHPPCCNPDHLVLGTEKDNTQDMIRRGRNRAAARPDSYAAGHEPARPRREAAPAVPIELPPLDAAMHPDAPVLSEEQIENFWSKVAVAGPDECWLWTAAAGANKDPKHRYGILTIRPRQFRAHVLARFLATNEWPAGLYTLHNCPAGDNPLCCNPAHLFLGSQADNVRDMHDKGRRIYVATPEVVREIRRLHDEGVSQHEIERRLKVISRRQIGRIVKGVCRSGVS